MNYQKSINPYTGELLKTFHQHSEVETKKMVRESEIAFQSWKEVSLTERAELMKKAADILRQKKSELARLISLEMGKVISESLAEIEKCAWVCDYYAEHATNFLADSPIVLPDGKKAKVIHQPLGCVLAIMPWNFPFWQVFRFAAPTLMAGNSALLKHASNVPQSAMAIQEVFESAGFPKNLFQTLLIGGKEASELLADPLIKAVSLTGSEKAGAAVARAAGSAIKKSLLELGGSDAFIVLGDADVENAVKNAVKSRMVNFGQSCIAAKRFIVEESVYDEFVEKLVLELKKLKQGDSLSEEADFACMARPDLAEELYHQVKKSLESGARLHFGNNDYSKGSSRFSPMVLTEVPENCPASKEELFGPVFSVFKVRSVEEAVKIANSSEFGLGGSVWTSDKKKGLKVAEQVVTGAMFINSMVASHPFIPFGGVKKSGYGRELGKNGILEFVNAKSIYLG